jgi:regulator of cell morphogenesis and NO signaling
MILEEKTVGEFVKEDYRFAHIFSKYGIDFCCGE